MTSYLYAVYDRLANTHGSLVEYSTDGAAIRDFKRMYEKGVTTDPSQYELHKIAKVFRGDPSSGIVELRVSSAEKCVVYNYSSFVAERLDGNALIDQIALLEQDDIDKVSDFLNTLKGGNENDGIK